MSDMEYEYEPEGVAGDRNQIQEKGELLSDENAARLKYLFSLRRPIRDDNDLINLGELFPEEE
jgi:hypothetical protein